MTQVGSHQAKAQWGQLLDRVARGERVVIIRHGKAVAMLVPPASQEQPDVRQVVKDMLAYRDRVKRALGGLTTREMREEGRR